MKLKALFLRISLLLFFALLGLWAVTTFQPFWIGNPELPASAILFVLGWCLCSAGCAAVRERGKHPRLMIHAIAVGGMTALGWIIYEFLTTIDPGLSSTLLWIMLPLTAWYALLLYIGILSMARMRARWMIGLRRIAIAVAGVFFLYVAIALNLHSDLVAGKVWAPSGSEFDDLAFRIGGVLGTLTLFFLLVLSLVVSLPRLEYRGVPDHRRMKVNLTCPRCGVRQSIKSDGDRCQCCRLHIKVIPT